MSERRKRLIEVAFPLEEVSAHSGHEKYVRQGHISTLHVWWARRPLAACRAFIYASLVDDPETDDERDALLREVADLASWDAVRHPQKIVRNKDVGGSGLTGAELLERARQRILACNGGKPPKLLDPFAGGGAIPLEGLRLGCEVEASDLNPVAVLLLKATLEYPQKFGQSNSLAVPDYILKADTDGAQSGFAGGELADQYRRNPLATDVRYWGGWVLERAKEELGEFYPPDPDGSLPVAYLWSRTIPCPNCQAVMPLLRQYWLARKDKKRVALEPHLDRERNRVTFGIVEGAAATELSSSATTSRGDTRCLLCQQVVKSDRVRQYGREGQLGEILTAVVLQAGKHGGKRYRAAETRDYQFFERGQERLSSLTESNDSDTLIVPNEPIAPDTLGLRIDALGFKNWGQLFNGRQALAAATFSRAVNEVHEKIIDHGLPPDYAEAIVTYLGLTVDRLVLRGSNQCIYHTGRETVENAISRGVLPPVLDYVETVSIRDSSGSWGTSLYGLCDVIKELSRIPKPASVVRQRDASATADAFQGCVITDPPYYAAVDYAGLSDFFYVWLKRSVGFLHPDLLGLPLTPKRRQAIMASERKDKGARQQYVNLMEAAFTRIRQSVDGNNVAGVAFASTDVDAWATLIEGLLGAALVPDASWPIDTEMQSGMAKVGQARLRTSVWMACRPRDSNARPAFLGDVLEEMRGEIRGRLLDCWARGVRGADFFISAIGPALSVYGQHTRVLRPDGSDVTVREFLDLVRRESTAVALEQVLHGADLGMVDSITRQYVTWVWSYSRASLDSGEALALCLATGAPFDDLTREYSIAVAARERSKKVVKLRTIAERAREDDDLGTGTPARPAPLIDELQRAAWLWGQNQSARLGEYRGTLGESRWTALLTLGQAVAECLPDGDEDRRIILGLLGATVRGVEPPSAAPQLAFSMEDGDGSD